MTTHYRTKPSSVGAVHADIVTYRHSGELVYVPVAPTYVQALSHARDVFPQLKGLRDASLSLSLSGTPEHAQKFVGISPAVWPKLITHMTRYQIVDVDITPSCDRAGPIPDITITYADAQDVKTTDPAPPYRASEVVDDEKASYVRPRSPSSASTLQRKRSWLFQKFLGQCQ